MPRILVVDDDAEIAMLVRRVLTAFGYDVSVATSAHQARARFARGSFDLLITDKSMPDEGGYELIRSLRVMHPGLPAVLMTAYPGLHEDAPTIQGYLAKPFKRLQSIYELVDRTLSVSAARTAAA